MEISPSSPSYLDLSISIPGFASSPSFPSLGGGVGVGGGGRIMKDLDINEVPTLMVEDELLLLEDQMSGGDLPSRKKLRLTKEQSRLLEQSFRDNHTLNPKQKEELANQLKLKPRQVEVWFQNRRARTKLKQTEMECEYLKRWFGSLTEENRRLQREVDQLRALRVGPPTVISPNGCDALPASTITMCPRCERVSSSALQRGPTINNPNSLSKSHKIHSQLPWAAC